MKDDIATSEDKYSTLPVDVVRVLLAPLTSIAAFAAGAYVIAYLLGYAFFFAYFNEAGAPWILGLLPAAAVLQPATTWGAALLTGFAAILWTVRHKGTSPFDVLRMFYAAAALAMVLGVMTVVFGDTTRMGTFALVALAFALLLFVIYVVARITEDDVDTAKVRTFGLMLGLALVTFLICNTLGTQTALKDFIAPTSSLPVTRLKGEPGFASWRIVSVLNSDAVVLVKIGKARRHVFRVVSANDLAAIEAVQ